MARAAPAAGVHLIAGTDSWLAEEELERILTAAVGMERGGDAVETFRGDETNWARLVDVVRTPSLFAARRAVVVRGADAMKGEGEELLAYLEEPDPRTTLVLMAAKPDKRRPLWKKVFDRAAVTSAEPLRGQKLKARIAEIIRARRVPLSGEAAMELGERVGQDLRRLVGELDKLEAYAQGRKGPLTAEDVAAVLGRGMGQPLYKLSDAIAARDAPGALAVLESVLEDGEPPLKVLGTLHRSLRQVVAAGALQRARAGRDEMLARLGLNGIMAFKLEGLLQAARRWTDDDLAAALRAMETADRRLKSGVDPRAALGAAVVEACRAKEAGPGRGAAPGARAGRPSAR